MLSGLRRRGPRLDARLPAFFRAGSVSLAILARSSGDMGTGDVGECLSFLRCRLYGVVCTAELRDGLLDVYHALSTRKAADRQPTGMGAMTEWMDIVKIVVDRFSLVLKERATS